MADQVRDALAALLARDYGGAQTSREALGRIPLEPVPLAQAGAPLPTVPKPIPRPAETYVPMQPGRDDLSDIATPVGPAKMRADIEDIATPVGPARPTNFLGEVGNQFGRGWNALEQAANVAGGMTGMLSPAEMAENLAANERDIAQYPKSIREEQQAKAFEEADGVWGTLVSLVTNPTVISGTIAESLPQSVPSIVGGAAGIPLGGAGVAAGVGVGSGTTEAASTILDTMRSKGVDIKDPAAVEKAFQDDAIMGEAKRRAVARGVAVGLFDALTAGIGGKIVTRVGERLLEKGATTTTRRAAEIAAGTGVEAAGGSAGEATAQVADQGKITDPKAILLEGVAEVPGAVTESGMAAAAALRKRFTVRDPALPGQQPSPIDGQTVIEDPDQEGVPAGMKRVRTEDGAEQIVGERLLEPQAEPAPAPAPQESAVTGNPAAAPADIGNPSSAVGPETRAILRKRRYTDADIDEMPAEELAAEVEAAREAGVAAAPEEVQAAGTYGAANASPPGVPATGVEPTGQNPNADVPPPIDAPAASNGAPPAAPVPPAPAPVGAEPPAGPVDMAPEGDVGAEPAAPVTPPAGPRTVRLFRGVKAGANPRSTDGTTGGGLFMTPDRAVAEVYAGEDGSVDERDVTFKNLLSAPNWVAAKQAVGLDRSASMADLIETARQQGYDGITFRTTNGQEFIQLAPQQAADGTRARPYTIATPEDMDRVRDLIAQPTEAQASAGNYQHGHIRLQGLDIAIENPKGSLRRGTDPDGKAWETELPADYGRLKGTEASDGDQIDVYIGDNPASSRAFVVDQWDPRTGKFDEPKVIMGVETQDEAVAIYDGGFSDGSGPDRRGAVLEMSVEDLRAALRNSAFGKGPVGARPGQRPAGRRSQREAAPVDIVRFVQGLGGIRDESGELSALGLNRFPGLINNARGRQIDYVREAAAEAGYFGGDPEADIARTTPRDLLDLLAKGSGKTFKPQDWNRVADRKNAIDPDEEAFRRDMAQGVTAALEAFEKENGPMPVSLYRDVEAAMRASGTTDVDEVLERVALEGYERELEESYRLPAWETDELVLDLLGEFDPLNADIPGFTDEDQRAKASEGREDGRPGGDRQAPDAGAAGPVQGAGAGAPLRGEGRGEEGGPVTPSYTETVTLEGGAKGQQGLLFGGETLATAPKIRKSGQQDADFGLFAKPRESESEQLDIEQAAQPPAPGSDRPAEPSLADRFRALLDDEDAYDDFRVSLLEENPDRVAEVFAAMDEAGSPRRKPIMSDEARAALWAENVRRAQMVVDWMRAKPGRKIGVPSMTRPLIVSDPDAFTVGSDGLYIRRGTKGKRDYITADSVNAMLRSVGLSPDEKPTAADTFDDEFDAAFEAAMLKIEKPAAAPAAKAARAPRKPKPPSVVDRMENFYRLGRIVKGYGGRDQVISFQRGEDQPAGWSVTVAEVDQNDRVIGEQRTHWTPPSVRELAAWEKENPVATAEQPKAGTSTAKPRQQRPAKDAAKSAVKNVAMGLDEVATGLGKLFGGNKLGSGPSFDEETYRAALPFFKAGVSHFKAAGEDIASLVSALVDYLAKSLRPEQIREMRPYLRQFVQDIRSGKESLDVSGAPGSVEPSGAEAARNPDGEAAVQPVAGGDAEGDRSGGAGRDAAGERDPADSGIVPESGAFALGAEGNPEGDGGDAGPDGGAAERGDDRGGAPDRSDRRPDDGGSDDAIARHARGGPGLKDTAARRAAQEKADKVSVVGGDLDNIRATLPLLSPEQQEDVYKAEKSYAQRKGMLFTNGTGTGKTYTGGGIIKRFVREGRSNIIVFAPSQGILDAWKAALADLGVTASILPDTDSAGDGVVLTTYANARTNFALGNRKWDLVVADESQTLSSNQAGDATEELRTFRALSGHPDGMGRWLDMQKPELARKMAALQAIKKRSPAQEQQLQKLQDEFREKVWPLREQYFARGVDTPALFLSATPFPYVENIDYAEGYLFSFGEDKNPGGYNQPNARQAFYIQHFGYRMRTGKLTKPDAEVDSSVMERQFHEWLKSEGALSGRELEVDADYERRFVYHESKIGLDIDRALKSLHEDGDGRYAPLHSIVMKRFDYLARMQLLEAINAEGAIPRIEKHLALGRKVVVFHGYNVGGGFNPFAKAYEDKRYTFPAREGRPEETVEIGDLWEEWYAKNPWVLKLEFADLLAPIDVIKGAFGDRAMAYNGTVSTRERAAAKRDFQIDGNGKDIIIVQSAAGEAGISLHDTTGKHRRVEIQLGMPIRPTTAIQTEGRIYRVGQVTDALFEYMITGTNWERWTFASKIAERASTAENLALGNKARTLKQSFIDGYQEADVYPPSDADGKGGKARDRALNAALSPFEVAKTLYFAQQKGRKTSLGNDYFATPEPLGFKMVEWAGLRPNEKVLEPSAGHGAIARFFPETTARTAIEPSDELASRLALNASGARIIPGRFENLHPSNKYDAIVMNPPFGTASKLAFEHIERATGHLRNGGRLVALFPQGPSADKRMEAFEDVHPEMHRQLTVVLPTVTFERAGTSVMARVVVWEKQTQKADWSRLSTYSSTRDLSNAETVKEAFDRLENIELGERVKPSVVEKDPIHLEDRGEGQFGGITFWYRFDGGRPMAGFRAKLGKDLFRALMMRAERFEGKYDRGGPALLFQEREQVRAFFQSLEDTPVSATADEVPAAPAPGAPPPAVRLKTAETTHGKTGAKVFVVTMEDRVERDVYDRLAAAAKAHGGYYSSFRGKGAVPGFQFKTEDDRLQFLAEVQPAGPRVAQAAGPMPAETKEDLRELARATTRTIRDIAGDDFRVAIRNFIAADPVSAAASGNAQAEQLYGVYEPADDVIEVSYIARAGMRNTGAHEAFHRLQLRLMTEQELAVLDRENPRMREWLASRPEFRNLDVAGMETFEVPAYAFQLYWMMKNGEAEPAAGLHAAVRRAFERLIGFFTRVRNFLEARGFQNADDIFAKAAAGKMRGRAKTDAGVRRYFGDEAAKEVAQPAYHGTHAADIDRFKLDKVGTGEGAQAYGWGLYFAQRRGVAEHYQTAVGGMGMAAPDGTRYPLKTVGDYEAFAEALEAWGEANLPEEFRWYAGPTFQRRLRYHSVLDAVVNDGFNDYGTFAEVRQMFETKRDNVQDAIDHWRGFGYEAHEMPTAAELKAFYTQALRVVDLMQAAGWKETKGALYQIDVPDDNDLMNWEKPLAEQPPGIMEKLQASKNPIIQVALKWADPTKTANLFYNIVKDSAAYIAAGEGRDTRGYQRWDREASLALAEAGIPGHRYFDGNSRYREEGDTYNYVIYDDAVLTPPIRLASAVAPAPTPQQASLQRARVLTRINGWLDPIRIKIQDRVLAVRRDQEWTAEQLGIPVDEQIDTYQAESLYHGRAGERLLDLKDKMVEPLIEDIRAARLTLEEVDQYLYARHAPERNAVIKARDPSRNAGSGMTDAEATAIIQQAQADDRWTDLQAIVDRIDTMQRETLDRLLQAGLITPETYKAIKATYKHYVPLRGWEAEPEGDDFPRIGKGFNVRGREFQTAFGRQSRADSPLAYAILQAQQSIVRSEKNRVLKTFLRYVNTVQQPDKFRVVKGEMKRRINPQTGLVESYFVPAAFMNQDRMVAVKVGGATTYIEVNDKRVLNALRQVGNDEVNALVAGAMKVARIFAALQTQWNPEFVISNAIRDVQTALINVTDVAGRPPDVRRRILRDAVSLRSIRGILGAIRKGNIHQSEYGRFYEEYRLAGGKISFLELNNIDRIKRELAGAATSPGAFKRSLRWTMGWIEDVNTAVENGVRLSVYISLRKGGITQAKAASIARELTVNFNRRGEWSPIINALYIFFNAATQGMARMAQAITRSRVVRRIVAGIVMGGFASELMNAFLGDLGDDDENPYDQIPDWVKERNMILMVPGSKNYIQIPMPLGYNAFHNAGRNLASAIRGKTDPADAAWNVVSGLVEAFNPVGTAPSALQYLSPTLLDPLVQIEENLNWNGMPIMPPKFDRYQPDSQLAFDSVNDGAKWIAEALNKATGGNVGRPGYVDVSPETIEHVTEFVTGGVGRFVLNAYKTGERVWQGGEFLPEQAPFIRRLYGSVGTSAAARSAFYEALDKVGQAHAELVDLKKAGDSAAVRQQRATYRAEHQVYERMEDARKELKKLRERKNKALKASPGYREKDERVREIEEQEKRVIDRALTAYRKAQERQDGDGP